MTCLLKLPAVLARTGGSKSSLYAEIAADLFPPPIKRGSASLWLDKEVDDFVIAYVAGVDAQTLREMTAIALDRRVLATHRRPIVDQFEATRVDDRFV